jgi:phosphatidate cytidylyltransferase
MFFLRLISWVVLVTLFLFSVLMKNSNGLLLFTIMAALGVFGVICEACTMLQNTGRHAYKVSSAIIATIMVVFVMRGADITNIFLMITLFIMFNWIILLFSGLDESVLDKVINSAAITFMLTVPMMCIGLIYTIGEGDTYMGRNYLLYLIIVTKIGDTAAYIVGTLSNKILKGKNHKIVPMISPKKSWEGTIGGLILSTLLSVIFWFILIDNDVSAANIITPIIAGALLFIGGFSGDLVESVFKRICKVKDSAKIFPGMGGVFDVVDSLIFNAPIFYFFLKVFIIKEG